MMRLGMEKTIETHARNLTGDTTPSAPYTNMSERMTTLNNYERGPGM